MPEKNEKLFAAALRRRLHPVTALHPKVLAHAVFPADIDACERFQRGIYNHAAGGSDPSYDALLRYIAFFEAMGDHGFLTEIFPGTERLVAKARTADRLRRAFEADAALVREGEAA